MMFKIFIFFLRTPAGGGCESFTYVERVVGLAWQDSAKAKRVRLPLHCYSGKALAAQH